MVQKLLAPPNMPPRVTPHLSTSLPFLLHPSFVPPSVTVAEMASEDRVGPVVVEEEQSNEKSS